MFYEEKLTRSGLYYRKTPDGYWTQANTEEMSVRIIEQKAIINDLQRQLSDSIPNGLGDK